MAGGFGGGGSGSDIRFVWQLKDREDVRVPGDPCSLSLSLSPSHTDVYMYTDTHMLQ